MEEKIVIVLNEMSEYLSITQMKKLQEVIIKTFAENEASKVNIKSEDFLNMFLAAKRIEGCSERTINYYRVTVQHLLSCTEKNVRKISTEEMREYLSNYQKRNNCSNVTIDNVRRNISSFFSWLEEEDYILKSPMKRIHKIKTKKMVKNTISDEEIEKLIEQKSEWIQKSLEKEKQKQSKQALYTKEEFKQIVTSNAKELINETGLIPNKITIKEIKYAWGSCSSKKNITINLELIKYSQKAIRYVILHELCHIKHMNHSKEFWKLVEKYIPEYKEIQKEFK